ncbi:hypothetical protein K439DRAFT_1531141 [Ramaria rubella]|nr:hypothetical protein K439DRAFT_1531141 [Ramaria rubella]
MLMKLPILAFGPNAISGEEHQWRRHRKVSSPAFDQASSQPRRHLLNSTELVWDEVIRLYNLSLAEGWLSGDHIDVKAINLIASTKLALYVISRRSFNKQTVKLPSDQDKKLFQEIVKEVVDFMIPHTILPATAYYLPIEGKFGYVMKERITIRRSDSDVEMIKGRSASWVLGYSFIFLFARHGILGLPPQPLQFKP